MLLEFVEEITIINMTLPKENACLQYGGQASENF
jgi:hypothetical protein